MIKIERKPKSKQLTEEYKKTYGIKIYKKYTFCHI